MSALYPPVSAPSPTSTQPPVSVYYQPQPVGPVDFQTVSAPCPYPTEPTALPPVQPCVPSVVPVAAAPTPAPAPAPAPVVQQQPTSTNNTTIIINTSGNCPKCLTGTIVETFTLAGLCMAIWCFPIGIICCLRWKRRFCDQCGAILS